MKSIKINSVTLTATFLALVFAVVGWIQAYAWFKQPNNTVNTDSLTGATHIAYFNGGNGTAGNVTSAGDYSAGPYQIHTAVQLYNFAWLQYLGYFNTQETGKIDQIYFVLTDDIDMTGYVLPPAGTDSFPFLGNFDGKDKKISNLTISNNINELTNVPDGAVTNNTLNNAADIIGFFGVVGSLPNSEYAYDSQTNEIKNLTVVDTTIKTSTQRSLAGIVAGYVNGTLSNIKVANTIGKGSKIVSSGASNLSYSQNLSDYTVVGYCTDEYKGKVDIVTVKLLKPAVKVGSGSSSVGDGSAWGGSIDMKSMYTRLNNIYNNRASLNSNYTYAKTFNIFYDKNGNELNRIESGQSTAQFKTFLSNTLAGSFSFARRGQNSDSSQYYYLNGGTRITNTRYFYQDTDAKIISDGNYYLNANGTSGIIQSTDSPTQWLKDGNYYFIETVTGNSATSSIQYFLNSDEYGKVLLSGSKNTQWISSSGKLYSQNGNLVQVNGENGGWAVSDNGVIRKISDGNYYLGTTSSAVTQSAATEWLFTNGYIHTVINNQNYYLNRNGSNVEITTSSNTIWTVADGKISTDEYILKCNNGTWIAELSTGPYYICNGTYYLNLSGVSIANGSTSPSTQWNLSNGSAGGYISTNISGVNYYLNNTNGTLTVSASQSTSWSLNNGIFSDGDYTLSCTNGVWNITIPSEFYLRDNTGRYLNATTGSVSTDISSNNKTAWTIDADGYLKLSNYYLRYNNNVSMSNSTSNSGIRRRFVLNSENKLYCSYYTRYVYYSSSWVATSSSSSASVFTKEPVVDSLTIIPSGYTLNLAESSSAISETNSTAKKYTSSAEPLYIDYSGTNNTFFPLNVDDSTYEAKGINTGYIISGSYDATTSQTYPYSSGDIRVSYYANSNISNSLTNNILVDSKIYTINNSGRQTISSSGIAYNKYSDSKTALQTSIDSDSNIYGLHFMNALIDKNSKITAPSALINGISYTDYEMPTDCIDFRLKEKGYINFFAGTYFSGNNSFFSFHKIYRDGNKISDIKEILEIFGTSDSDDPYIYKFSDTDFETSDGKNIYTNLADLPSKYTSLFNTDWIKTQSSLNSNSVYYFEIPADEGEFALGSVNGGTGAYLLYLDISANAQKIKKTTTTETSIITTKTYQYPLGVAFAKNSLSSTTPLESAFFSLQSGFNGTAVVTRTENSISSTSGTSPPFIGEGISLEINGQEMSAISIKEITEVKEVVTIVEENLSESKNITTVTTITEIVTNENNSTTASRDISQTVTTVKQVGSVNETTTTTVTDNPVDDGHILIPENDTREIILEYHYVAEDSGTVLNNIPTISYIEYDDSAYDEINTITPNVTGGIYNILVENSSGQPIIIIIDSKNNTFTTTINGYSTENATITIQ